MGCGASKITAIETSTTGLDKSEASKEKLVTSSESDEVKIDPPNCNNFNSRQRFIFKHRLSSIHESACELSNPVDCNSVAVQSNLENDHQSSQTDDLAIEFTVIQDEFEKWLKMTNAKTFNSNLSFEDVDLNIIKRIRTIGSSVVYDVGIQAAPTKRAGSTQTFATLIKPKSSTVQKDCISSLAIHLIEDSSDHNKLISELVEDNLDDALDEDHKSPASISTPLAHVEEKLNNDQVEEELNLDTLTNLSETNTKNTV